ncbi:MAG: fasciclin domain-containing protein [Pseudomonadota bacterium]
MKVIDKAVVGFVTALSLSCAAVALDPQQVASQEAQQSGTVVDVAAGNDQFTTLVAALNAAGLTDALQGDGPFTVFAPINEAFAALPEGTVDLLLQPENRDALQSVLTYHVVTGTVTAADLVALIEQNGGSVQVETVEGTVLTAMLANGGVALTDGAGATVNVVATDITASNGVVHVVDTVMMPTTPDA